MPAPKLVAKRPQAGTPRTWEFPGFTRTRFDSGFQVIVANTPGRTLAAAQLLFEAGPGYETPQEGGIAAIAAKVLIEGTGVHKGPTFIQALEGLGASIEGTVDWDSFKLNLEVPVGRLEPALELFAEAARDPQFPWREVDRLIQERVAGIFQSYANAASRATMAFDKLTYTPGSPYSRPAEGNYWAVKGIGKRKVKKYYERFATPDSATLILVGDLEGVPADKVAEKLFGDWKAKEPERTQAAVSESLTRNTVLLVNRPESTQSQIQIGHIGVPRSSPDYFPILVMATALGGLFDSRLNRTLREEKGFTYGAQAGFNFRRKAGPFRAVTAVDAEKTTDAVAETLNVLRKINEEGITKQELAVVKGFLTGVFTLRFETPESIASALSELVTYGLPANYFETYRQNVESVTLDEANRAAAEYLRPEPLGIVIVGDAEKVRGPLQSAEFGPVAQIQDPEPGEPPTD
jgi:zinc protease